MSKSKRLSRQLLDAGLITLAEYHDHEETPAEAARARAMRAENARRTAVHIVAARESVRRSLR